ncbi:hypothetical protein Snov_3786 [Ancylobacter novellus DSM 506]|uniref:Glycosyltransferase RgtA/B/C/D-like domain-containing protein n=1 Tax=Ancylobacter novellus (strain ATCC 8093 / DSM 506 / JCM 20403 / CCM 1077 / IAM 12100 / NBRC 12443 / NCIMB 10456) TaxID=639283 RepID=D6ZYT7_ANCN5|nr:hypothetical protein [Ancylobacter novellus]ADH91056.1 hypothetical protein Snov_3786 [Ancylobacter novellus DSM 506]
MAALRGRSVIAILALIWIFMVYWDFGLPGLQADEANHYAFAPGILSEGAARLHHYRYPDNFIDRLDGLARYPIVGGSLYNTDIGAYVGIPLFISIGFSVESLRIFEGFLTFGAILSLVALIARIFGWGPAFFFGLIAITDPSNIFSARSQAHYFWYVILFAALAAHCLLSDYWQPRRSPWLAIGAGSSTALSVLCYFVGVFFAIPLILTAIWTYRRRPWHLVAFLIAGIVAYSPVIYAVVSIYLASPALLANFGMPGFALAESIPTFSVENLRRMSNLIQGGFGYYGHALGVVGYFRDNYSTVRLAIIGGMLALLVVTALRSRSPDSTKSAFYLVASGCVAAFITGAFFLKAINYHHFIAYAVVVYMLMASLIASDRVVKTIAIAACSVLIATNLVALHAAHKALNKTGGLAYHNEAYSVPAELFRTTLKDYRPVFASWGSHLQFLFQTRGRIPYTFIGSPSTAEFSTLVKQYGKIAIIIGVKERRTVTDFGGPVDFEMHFSQRDGAPLFDIILVGQENAKPAPQ